MMGSDATATCMVLHDVEVSRYSKTFSVYVFDGWHPLEGGKLDPGGLGGKVVFHQGQLGFFSAGLNIILYM